jgi:hypothetical protein
MSNTSKLIYALAFQIGWFVCIMGGDKASLFYTVAFVAAHFCFLKITLERCLWLKESLWLLLIFLSGAILETLSFSAGFLYSNTSVIFFQQPIFPPLWLISLWLLFALALRTCLSFVFKKPKLTYLLCTIAIPVNYYAGAKLNSDVDLSPPISFNLSLITVLWIFLLWCLIHTKRFWFEDMFNAR